MTRRASNDEIAAVLLAGAANFAVNRLPASAYVPANLAAAGAMTWFARRLGASWDDMGMHPKRLGSGIRWGLGAAVPIAAGIGLAAAIPATRRIFVDERAAAGRKKVLFETLVRIPLGTALAEEVLFRGALLGVLERRRSRPVADAVSGVLFGLSHVLPTVDRLNGSHSDAVGEERHARAGAVLGVVVATMAAGYGLAWLRDRSESLVAPVIAHAVLNDLAFLAALAASRDGNPVSTEPG